MFPVSVRDKEDSKTLTVLQQKHNSTDRADRVQLLPIPTED